MTKKSLPSKKHSTGQLRVVPKQSLSSRLSWSTSDLPKLQMLEKQSKSLEPPTPTLLSPTLRTRFPSASSIKSGSSNGSQGKRQAKIHVSGLTKQLFNANESIMVDNSGVVMSEDFEHEHIIKAEKKNDKPIEMFETIYIDVDIDPNKINKNKKVAFSDLLEDVRFIKKKKKGYLSNPSKKFKNS